MNPLLNVKYVNITPPAAIVDNASFTTAELDTKGWSYCTFVVQYGATDIATAALAMTESDTSGSGFSNVTGLVFGTSTNAAGSTSTLPSATDDNNIFLFQIDLTQRKRYLDLTFTGGDGAAGTYASVLAILSDPIDGPAGVTAQQGATQILRV
jgi:hypothetical protein